MKTYTLNSGAIAPAIGYGTWEITPDSEAKRCVAEALEAGFRIIDTAKAYDNEKGVGEAIRESGIAREEIFVTTKLWNDDQGYDQALQECQTSLDKLGLDYLDLYLIHWPATPERHETWEAFERLQQDGLIKAAGVSNYTIEHLKELFERSGLTPAVNQVEFHPFIYQDQKPLLEYCQEQGILLEAYSPVSRISSDGDKRVDELAEKLDKTPQQLALRWCIQHDVLPLSRSTSADHIKDNLAIFDFELDDEAMAILDDLSDGERVTPNPEGMGDDRSKAP